MENKKIRIVFYRCAVGDNGIEIELDKEDEPIFYINDLLPHLGKAQMTKTGDKIISGEQLNLVFGGMPNDDRDVKEKIKQNVNLN